MVAYHNHPKFKVVQHLLIPVFGSVANLACMVFYLVGPFMGFGTKMEPLCALGIAWSGPSSEASTSSRSSKKTKRTTFIESKAVAS